MNIRPAAEGDIPRLLEFGRAFHAQGKIRAPLVDDDLAAFLGALIAGGGVFMHERGTIGGALSPAYCGNSWVMAVELFWWAERDGMPLLRAFEDWALSRGAQEVRMTSLASLPRADAVLRRKGYAPTEISYSKVI